MRSENGLTTQVLAGVISGLILLALGWFFGLLPKVWGWITSALGATWSLLTFRVPIPIFVLAAAALLLAILVRGALKRSSRRSGLSSSSKPDSADYVPSDLELRVLVALVQADGAWMLLDSIADRTGSARLLVEQALEKLSGQGFLYDSHNYLHGTSFRLSSKGRDFAIKRGLLGVA